MRAILFICRFVVECLTLFTPTSFIFFKGLQNYNNLEMCSNKFSTYLEQTTALILCIFKEILPRFFLNLPPMSKINPKLSDSWMKILSEEFEKPSYLSLKEFLENEVRTGQIIYPSGSKIFAALNCTSFESVKVIIIGQDPYHNPGQAEGLSFSVPIGQKIPPSLQNIFKELKKDLQIAIPSHGNLQKWADQGVLLLNATLTVRENQPGSHQKKGWENFTDAIMRELSFRKTGLIFVLWGKFAEVKENLIDTTKHFILKAAHPSPFSVNRGFYGCKHFSKINELLIDQNKKAIDWNIEIDMSNVISNESLYSKN